MTLSRILIVLLLVAFPRIADAQDDQSQGDQTQTDRSQTDQGQGAQQSDQSQGQTQTGDQGQSASQAPSAPQPTMDPVTALQGLWRVDKVDGSAASDSLMGRMFRIDATAITSMTVGTCSNPTFAPVQDATDANKQTVAITCVGQPFASAVWDATDPDTVNWSEPNLQVVLHRVASAATLKSATEGGSSSSGNNSGGGSNSDDNNSSDDNGD